MCSEMVIRRFAGVFILASLALGWFVSPWWYLLAVLVGMNLFQSSFTGFCPLERVLSGARLFGCRPGVRGV
jgi:hypothetical protein